MHDSISIKITDADDTELLFSTLDHLEKRSGYHFEKIGTALKELIDNVISHAYEPKERSDLLLEVDFTLKECQLQITVHEQGEPFDFTPYLSEPIDHSADHHKGFYRIYDLVDYFYFATISKEGKVFTLISYLANCHLLTDIDSDNKAPSKKQNIDEIEIRSFINEDAEAISKLIYKNYDYTYYKPYFYEPHQIATANQEEKVHSIVALHHKRVIGHFALVPRRQSSSAEIAIAVVHPEFKGIGIMNHMFDALIDDAKRREYRSLFGEAIMLHPYSQQANLKQNMTETALVLGLVPSDIEIEHDLKIEERSGVLLSYLLFQNVHQLPILPTHYEKQIQEVYSRADITFTSDTLNKIDVPSQTYVDSELNLGYIQIESTLSESALTQLIEELMLEQTDMIYADINLHRIKEMDSVVEKLNRHGFFYSGLMFDHYHDEDYLRLQKICSNKIETEHLVCYSDDAKALLSFIKEDKKRVSQL